jgi:hypothetical protein
MAHRRHKLVDLDITFGWYKNDLLDLQFETSAHHSFNTLLDTLLKSITAFVFSI